MTCFPGRRLPLLLPLLAAFLLFLGGCASSPARTPQAAEAKPAWKPGPVSPAETAGLAMSVSRESQGLASWNDMAPAIRASLRYVSGKPASAVAVAHPWARLTWGQLRDSLETLLALLPQLEDRPQLLAEQFTWVRVDASTLLTGYYEPILEASLTPGPEYPYPIYRKPPGRGPLPERRDIDYFGALAGQGLEIAWAKDPIDVFFLHVQGSGRLRLPDGSIKFVLYAGSNGHPYESLGQVLIDRGDVTVRDMSMQAIRAFFERRPDLMPELLSQNPKYIFFRLADDGPFGAINAKLTPRVSTASNFAYLPGGSLMAIDAPLPGFPDSEDRESFFGLTLVQDTGTMRMNHLDLFCGTGDKAAHQAGLMKGRAKTYLLVSKTALEM